MTNLKNQLPQNAYHCFCLWHMLGKVSKNLGHVIKRHENCMAEFEKFVHRSYRNEEFEKRWWKILEFFYELKDDEWTQSLYEDRKQCKPTYM